MSNQYKNALDKVMVRVYDINRPDCEHKFAFEGNDGVDVVDAVPVASSPFYVSMVNGGCMVSRIEIIQDIEWTVIYTMTQKAKESFLMKSESL